MEEGIVNRFQKFEFSAGENEGVSIAPNDYKFSMEECSRRLIGKIQGEKTCKFPRF